MNTNQLDQHIQKQTTDKANQEALVAKLEKDWQEAKALLHRMEGALHVLHALKHEETATPEEAATPKENTGG